MGCFRDIAGYRTAVLFFCVFKNQYIGDTYDNLVVICHSSLLLWTSVINAVLKSVGLICRE